MKKIAIVTIVDFNYGNRLQNYAVQEVFKKLNLFPETIRLSNNFFKIIKTKLRDFIIKDRFTNFRIFDRNITWSRYSFFDEISEKYDYFSIGSDQVWNPSWYDRTPYRKNTFLLAFASSEKRICFSPSFGIKELPDRWKPWFKEQLDKFNKISVREEAGVDIVKELTGKTAELLIDPTLMLDKDEWIKITKKPKNININTPYILTYFLGGRSENVNNDLQKYASDNGLKIYHLNDKLQNDLYNTGPSEFIYLISHAKLVITDSFHACVFSFLFQKPFLVYDRIGSEKNMMSRIDTFLKKFDIQRKYAYSDLHNELFECNYENGFGYLKKEREKVINFLTESLQA